MVPRLRIGLTGGIASGKSTAAQRFLELGIPVLDADESARTVVLPGSPGLAAVVRRFGPEVLTSQGVLDRRALRNTIFADPGSRLDLEAILHPLIRNDMELRAAASDGPYLVLAIPLLIETGLSGRVDRILVIDVREDIQRRRVIERDGVSPDQANAILAAQTGRESRLQAADDVITNSGSVSELRKAVDRLHGRYLELAAAVAN